MGSPIDPVTGLPMVGVPDVVSQIPLGVQVVPWDDIKAVDRPQGGPAYPNDIIDTFAWVTGEDISRPGTVHAGTMTSDRRLRVDTGASGGSSPINAQAYDWNTGTTVGGGFGFVCTGPPIGKKLYWISVGVAMDPGSLNGVHGSTGTCQIYIPTDNSFGQLPILTFPLIFPGSAQPGPQYMEIGKAWPDGMLPVSPHNNGLGNYEFWFQQSGAGLGWVLTLVYGAE